MTVASPGVARLAAIPHAITDLVGKIIDCVSPGPVEMDVDVALNPHGVWVITLRPSNAVTGYSVDDVLALFQASPGDIMSDVDDGVLKVRGWYAGHFVLALCYSAASANQ